MNRHPARVDSGDARRRDDNGAFVRPLNDAAQESRLSCPRFARQKDRFVGLIDELRRNY